MRDQRDASAAMHSLDSLAHIGLDGDKTRLLKDLHARMPICGVTMLAQQSNVVAWQAWLPVALLQYFRLARKLVAFALQFLKHSQRIGILPLDNAGGNRAQVGGIRVKS